MMETAGAGGGEAEASKEEAQVTNEDAQLDKEQVKRDIARSVLGAFGLQPFHVFDGERYHVGFAASKAPVEVLKYDEKLLDNFFSNCCRSSNISTAREDSHLLRDVPAAPVLPPAAAEEEWQNAETREDELLSPTPMLPPAAAEEEWQNAEPREDEHLSPVPTSPKEVYYIMEEHYLSASPAKEIEPIEENRCVPTILPRTHKEIYFVMEDNYLSPEELRLAICFPSLLSPASPAKDIPMNDRHSPCRSPCEADHLDDPVNDANIVEASTHSNVGKVKDDKVTRAKKKRTKVVEEYDASQSVRLDKAWVEKATSRRRKATPKKGSNVPPEAEPSWNGLDVGDLEEQIGDSWVEDEKLRDLRDENPGDVVNPGQMRKSFWPTPLYGSPGRQVKAPPPLLEKINESPRFAVSEDENSDEEDFEESLEQSRKREEVALAKYALLFKDDQSWRKKFLDGFKLTCDICFSKRKIKRFSSVLSLLAHAMSAKKLRQPEHRGYAQAISNLLHLDQPGNTPAGHSVAGDQSYQIEGVWPPVVVLENTVIGLDFDGSFICLNTNVLTQMLRALGDQGMRKLHPIVGGNGLTGQVLVEFPTSHRGWIDAKHMHRQFELHARSYEDWLRLKPKFKGLLGDTIEVQESSGLVAVLENRESVKRILYGYLATPHVMKYIDPSKEYVDWDIENLKDFFDISDSECSQAFQM